MDEIPPLVFQKLNAVGLGIETLRRAKVPGGWIIVVRQIAGCGTTFMPDPEHKWDGASLL
jgi:hypothetical protein